MASLHGGWERCGQAVCTVTCEDTETAFSRLKAGKSSGLSSRYPGDTERGIHAALGQAQALPGGGRVLLSIITITMLSLLSLFYYYFNNPWNGGGAAGAG